jgi:DNA-binding transcriptional LysR family regulator
VSREELAAATWLLREEGSGTRATAEELFGALEIRPQTLALGSNGALREAVAVGLGVALLSRGAVREDLATDPLEEWSHPALPIEREWHLVAHDAARASRVVADFVSHAVAAGEAAAGRGTDPFRSQVGRGRARAQSSARYRRRASRPRDG